MSRDPVTLRQIQWDRVLPGLLLLKAASVACSVRVMVSALVCVLLCNAGSTAIEDWAAGPADSFSASSHSADAFRKPAGVSLALNTDSDSWYRHFAIAEISELAPPQALTTPVRSAADLLTMKNQQPLRPFLLLVWHAAVLGLTGVVIGRITAESVCRHSQTSLFGAQRFAFLNVVKIVVSTAIGGSLVGFLWLLCFVARWVYRIAAVGQPVVAIAWPLVVLVAALTVVAAVICGVGWLLSLAAIAADCCDGSDALSRGISYSFSRRLLTAAYGTAVLVLMWFTGSFAWALFSAADMVLSGVMAGANPPRELPANIISWWKFLIGTIPQALQLAMFLSGSTIGYLLLRHAEDGILIDEMDGGDMPATSSSGETP